MKLASIKIELEAIKTICSSDENHSAFMLGRVSTDYFGYPPVNEIYHRVLVLIKEGKNVPNLKMFREDLTLSKESRDSIQGKIKSYKSITACQNALAVLENYRKVRLVHIGIESISNQLSKAIDGDGFAVDKSIDSLENVVRKTKEGADDSELIHTGKGDTGKKLIKKILNNDAPNLIPTGFAGFDDKNGGLPKRGVAVMGSNTSGGKSVMGMTLLKNFYLYENMDTCLASFEMDGEEMYGRLASNLSRVNHELILKKTCNKKQKKLIKKAYEKFQKHGKKKGIRWSLYVPKSDITFYDLMYRLKPYNYKVILIDYISLMKQVSHENQAASLAEITRQAKQWSRQMKCLIVILVQMTDDEQIKYSRGIAENADNIWLWRFGDRERETHIIDIMQKKARNQRLFNFPLLESYETMSLGDYEDANVEEEPDGVQRGLTFNEDEEDNPD